ncbi:MAG: hypothetical protein KAY61_05475 [Candidatus Eisenbacteria bacterium]|nr:hypothetical protein [Candidatus Eisenbacteria bacterium]
MKNNDTPEDSRTAEEVGERAKRSLASLVRAEAMRDAALERITPDPARLADGWKRRFVIERARVGDLVALYEEGGFEVVADAVAPEQLEDDCTDCKLVVHLDYVQVYTRKKREQAQPE